MLRYCGRKRGVSVRLPVGQAPPALYFSMAAGGRAFCSLALCSWEAQRTSSPLAPASPPSPATSLEPRAGRRLHELLTSSRVPSLTILQRGQPGGRLTSGDRDDDRPLLVSAEDVPADVPTHQLSVSSSQPPLHPLSLPRPGSPPKNRLNVSTGPFCFSAHPPKVSYPSKVQRKPAVSLTSLCPPGWPPLRHELPFLAQG